MRACDACYALKEKCTNSLADTAPCDRCARLARECTRNRSARRLGRKPLLASSLRSSPHPDTSTNANASTIIDRSLSPFGFLANSLGPCEEFMIRQLSDPSQLAGFNIAPKIAADVHQQIMYTLLHHYRETHDGFISCYAAFASQKMVEIPGYLFDDSINRGNNALREFRRFKAPTDMKEFVPWIWLSLCVALHTRCALGWSASSIRRYVLSHIVRLGTAGREMAKHPIVTIMIIGDIYECLLHHDTPLMNLPECNLEHQGAFVSTCAPLIRNLFHICMIRSGRETQQDDSTAAEYGAYRARLEEIEREVQAWKPELQSTVVESLSETGLMHLQTQVRTHTLAVLLCIHRSRHDSSSGDALALDMARQIIWDLDCASLKGGRAPSCVTLPFMLAAVEIKDPDEQVNVLSNVSRYVTGTPFGIHVSFRAVLEEIWAWKSRSREYSWTTMLQRILSSQITI